MENIWKKLSLIALLMAAVMAFAACSSAPQQPADLSVPQVEKAIRINATDVEIYFADGYTGSSKPDVKQFAVTDSKGNSVQLSHGYGYGGGVFFDNMLTLRLAANFAEGDGAETLKLTYNGNKYDVPYDAYYKYSTVADCGVTVKGGRTLIQPEKTLARAAEMVDVLLSESQFLADKMVESGCFLAVYGPDEHAYYIPEHRTSYDPKMLYVEGFGGTTCSITEANVWHWLETTQDKPRADYFTKYWDENILAHEFSHGIKISGMDILADQSLANEYQMLYRHAKAAGLWPDSYAISNSDEFFATLTTIWFNVMNESGQDDYWDGVRGPINTRDELYNYDKDTYRFFSKIYPFTTLGENWENVADKCTVTTLEKEKAVDLEKEYTFAYPAEAVASADGINFTDEFKIVYNPSGHVLDTNATSFGAGLWWDYVATYFDTAGPAKYTFEEVESVKQENGKSVYTVKIRNVDNGYLSVKNGKVIINNMAPAVFTVAVDSNGIAEVSCADGNLYIDETPADGTIAKVDFSQQSGQWRAVALAEPKNIVFVHDATADGRSEGTTAAEGDTVKLEAAVPQGKSFTGWRVTGGTVADEKAISTTLTMPAGDVVVWAEFE
ncbi:MAG: hypothetical protein E7484_02210 [Ruminococcaceae bacterium]|nr:hypothetical protein [Oscillospiraceae bacterium]